MQIFSKDKVNAAFFSIGINVAFDWSLISFNSDHADDQVTYSGDFQHTPVLLPALFCVSSVCMHLLSLKGSFVYFLKVIAISCIATITTQIPKDQFIYYCFALFCVYVCIWSAVFLANNRLPATPLQLHLLYYTLDRTSIAILATIAPCKCHIAMTKSRSAYKSRSAVLFLLLWLLLRAY